ncbi:attacin-like [Pararge aegeria]|uniref:Jg19983 protein n=1 Tax=Pararge aegeria aegeria TaxID=348720 RepID=A0A8S4R8Z2_9NEOP|nr:attacin-like [Pararge aegeria]CAH2230229.1 jg19983 [Pararge aegeria aegeria]
MFAKIALFTVFLAAVSSMSIPYRRSSFVIEDHGNLMNNDIEDLYFEHPRESVYPIYPNTRVRRQLHGAINTNPDGSTNIMGKLPIAGNDQNVLSAVGGLGGLKNGGGYSSASGGLALDNVNGHGLSLTGKHIPSVADQLTAAGRANLFHNDNHDLAANAFATRTMPKNPAIPNFNSYGGGLDYMYKNKVGAGLSAAHTDIFDRTDYSAMGKLNLFRNPTTSFDFNAGVSKSVSPFLPRQSWEPSAGLSFTKYF